MLSVPTINVCMMVSTCIAAHVHVDQEMLIISATHTCTCTFYIHTLAYCNYIIPPIPLPPPLAYCSSPPSSPPPRRPQRRTISVCISVFWVTGRMTLLGRWGLAEGTSSSRGNCHASPSMGPLALLARSASLHLYMYMYIYM